MAGYYDPNKDYSKAIETAKSQGLDTTKLEQERANKIADKYKGKEPTMYGSDKTYSQLSGSNGSWQNQDTISNALVISNSKQNDAIKQQMEQEAQAGNWDKVGSLTNQLMVPNGRYGGYDMAYANQVWGEIANKYGYNAKDYYDSQYDKAYGAGSSAVFDATNGAVKTADQWAALTGGAAIPSQALVSGGNQAGGISSLEYGAGSDASQYIRDMFANQQAAQLAALKSTYEQNVLDYQAQDDLISAEAQRQRNQAAAQNDLQRMYMNEMGIMQGLNPGTTGQMALAQSAALQGNLASIGTQEQQSLSDSALERSKLKAQYSAAVDQAVAQNNYELANALYQEYVRQDNLAQQKAAAALEQQNWLDKFNYQKEQDALAQQNWQAQFDYQKAQDDLNYQLTLQKLYGSSAGNTGSTVRTSTPVKAPSVGYNNGGLTNEQVKVLQNHYGVTADGLWGKNSSNAAGGLTAAQAWDAFQSGPLKSIEQSVGMNRTSTGQANAIQKALQAGSITEAQAEAMLRKFGIM